MGIVSMLNGKNPSLYGNYVVFPKQKLMLRVEPFFVCVTNSGNLLQRFCEEAAWEC